MNPRSIPRALLFPLLAAAALSACSDRLPSDPSALAPRGPLATLTPTNPFVVIDAGGTHSCGLTSAGQPWCWGRNAVGQLGDSTASSTLVPVATYQSGWSSFSSITAGGLHTCALTSAGAAWCWGTNGDGRLGDGTVNLGLAPVLVQGGITFASLSAGDAHTCGLDSSGQAYCWGNNSYGQLGDSTKVGSTSPGAVHQPAGVTFTQIASGARHSCALTSAGQAYCWGYNGDGQLGIGAALQSLVPAAVSQPGGVTFTSIYTEYQHTCGLTSGGQAYCWGLNGSGQLGDNTTTTPRKTPVAVQQSGGLTFVSLTTGSSHSCGLTSGGQEYCWGADSNGQLGIGSLSPSLVPVAVSQPVGVTFSQVSTGSVHNCALDGNGQAWCWGRNNWGQVGDGTTTQRTSPVAVSH
jgi:alpha-tubulin suppressor-like RCC1 family protein